MFHANNHIISEVSGDLLRPDGFVQREKKGKTHIEEKAPMIYNYFSSRIRDRGNDHNG